jgi:hypothetical protein
VLRKRTVRNVRRSTCQMLGSSCGLVAAPWVGNIGLVAVAASAPHRCHSLVPRRRIVKGGAGLLDPWLGSCFGRKGLRFAAVIVAGVVRVVVAAADVGFVVSAGIVGAGADTHVVDIVGRRMLVPAAAGALAAAPAAKGLQGLNSRRLVSMHSYRSWARVIVRDDRFAEPRVQALTVSGIVPRAPRRAPSLAYVSSDEELTIDSRLLPHCNYNRYVLPGIESKLACDSAISTESGRARILRVTTYR